MATTLARFTQSACSALWAVRGKPCAAADAVGAESTGRRIAPLFHCERLGLGAGWCNTPSPVLRGAGNELSHGRDIVAPPGNQAATENTNFCLNDGENPAYSPVRPDPCVLVGGHDGLQAVVRQMGGQVAVGVDHALAEGLAGAADGQGSFAFRVPLGEEPWQVLLVQARKNSDSSW